MDEYVLELHAESLFLLARGVGCDGVTYVKMLRAVNTQLAEVSHVSG